MAKRLHDYAWRRMCHWHELNPQSRWIPAVTSLVVYPRQGRSWSAPLRLEDHYSAWARTAGTQLLDPWALRSAYLLDKLSTQGEQTVLAHPGPPLVPVGLLVLRLAGTEELAQRLPHWSELFARVHASAYGPQALYRVVYYLHQLGDEQALEATKRVLHSFMKTERAEAFMRTMAEVLKERGRPVGLAEGEAKGLATGMVQGEAQGLAKALLRLLAARGGRGDAPGRQRIQSCVDVAMLERWHERALSATHLSEVLDSPAQ
jgi:hypothetical protein